MNFESLEPFGLRCRNQQLLDMSGDDIKVIQRLLADHGFMIFQQQTANDEQFVAFLKKLGSLTFTIGEKPVAHQPDLNTVSSIGRTQPPKSVFHTDTSYVSQPPAYTALRAVLVPEPDGGSFFFSNQYTAYDTLPERIKSELTDAGVLHVVSGLTLNDSEQRECWHPLFKTHPISGRKALFLSTPARCQAISSIDTDRAQRILKLLYRHSIRRHRIYEHQWQAGDILLWDNRCTMHRAELVQTVGDRLLHRGLVLGQADEIPVPKR